MVKKCQSKLSASSMIIVHVGRIIIQPEHCICYEFGKNVCVCVRVQVLACVCRVATNLENMENLENSGNLKNCQNIRENSGKFEFL